MIISHKEETLDSSDSVAKVMQAILNAEDKVDQKKEHLWVIGLNRHKIIEYIELVSIGSLSSSIVHPRETFRFAIMKAVDSILLVHNHPGGNPQPSAEDIAVTNRLKAAGEIIGIEVLDHIIITKDKFSSLRKNSMTWEGKRFTFPASDISDMSDMAVLGRMLG